MKVNNVELDAEDDVNLLETKWRSSEADSSIFSRKNIGFTIGLFVLTVLVITGLVFLRNAYVPCSLARDASVDNVFAHLVRLIHLLYFFFVLFSFCIVAHYCCSLGSHYYASDCLESAQ
jgi:hypothetical protein